MNRPSRRKTAAALALLTLLIGSLSAGSALAAPTAPTERRATGRDAPLGSRVDLVVPSFSNPTSITNPLFPKSTQTQVIQLGVEAGDALRFEVTQLPGTRTVSWGGQQIRTRITHFVAYTNGELVETALDYYAQGDDGSVWYFGEDVNNYENGVLANHDGTWLAGRDGPPGMIMPAHPQVGDTYRPENIPGFVFEEATVIATGLTVDGPSGPVSGAIRIQASLLDGSVEEKIYAPGYGEFQAEVASLDELYTVAVAVPIDALPGRTPRALTTLTSGARNIHDAARSTKSHRLTTVLDRMIAAWEGYRGGEVPPMLVTQMDDALAGLDAAVQARKWADIRQAAIDLGQATLDLRLQHEPVVDIDEARIGLWRRQLRLDRRAGDAAAVAADRVTIAAISDRIRDLD